MPLHLDEEPSGKLKPEARRAFHWQSRARPLAWALLALPLLLPAAAVGVSLFRTYRVDLGQYSLQLGHHDRVSWITPGYSRVSLAYLRSHALSVPLSKRFAWSVILFQWSPGARPIHRFLHVEWF